MSGVFGADMLTNQQSSDISLPTMDVVDLGNFDSSPPPPPSIVPPVSHTGLPQASDGLHNLNASAYGGAAPSRMSDVALQRKKYDILRKFDRLSKLGVPCRKRFTLDSPLEEMELELEFVKKERNTDSAIQQFCDWYVTGMSGVEWSSKNVPLMQAFGLKLDGLSESAQLNVSDMESDFEQLYEEYGDKLILSPLVTIPLRICKTIYMVHITNQLVQKSPVPGLDQVLKANPEIATQLANAVMQQQTYTAKAANHVAATNGQPNPLAGLSSFISGMIPPPPPQATQNTTRVPMSVKSPVKIPQMQAQARPQMQAQPQIAMQPPSSIDELLKSVSADTKTVSSTKKKGGSTGKSSVVIKL